MFSAMDIKKTMMDSFGSFSAVTDSLRSFSATDTVDTMMDSFRSFIEIFQGGDETATEILWKVDNFSFCHLQNGEKIHSPLFKVGKHSDCYFELYPKGQTEGSVMDVHLKNSPHHYKPELLFFSIVSARHTGLDEVWETKMRTEDITITASLTVKDNEQIRQNPELLTSGDTLTIRCVVQGNSDPKNILLRSRFIVKKFHSTLEIKDFEDKSRKERKKTLPDIKNPDSSKDAFKIYLSFLPINDRVEVHVVPYTFTHNHFVTSKLLVIDSDGIPLNLLKKGRLFTENTKEEWISSHTFNVDFFLDNKESYLTKNTLTLMIELTDTYQVCSEEVRYGPKTLGSKDSSITPGCLKSDLQMLLEDKTSCDVHLKIGSESVSVHKAILRARSSVFKAMMDHDTVENATNTVVIPDMDMETLQHMVNFMYTDTVTDLNWSSAIHLYYASDKYDIGLLKRRCAEYLVENMNQSNIYEVLVLSDMHDDDLLKKSARNFIFTQKSTLVNSEDWKTIENNYPNLALDVLRELYCKAVVPKVEDTDSSKGVVANPNKTGRGLFR